MNATLLVRCDQNRLFGCGKRTRLPATRYTIGVDRKRIMAGGRCAHCGLPLAKVQDDRSKG